MGGESFGRGRSRPGFEPLEGRLLLGGVDVAGAFAFLDEQLAQFADWGDVYTEVDSGGDLYAASGWLNVPPENGVLEIDPAWTGDVFSGQTAMKVAWSGQAGSNAQLWAALVFEWPAGLLGGQESGPGWDLAGASQLSFQAKSDAPLDGVEVGFGIGDYDGFEPREWIVFSDCDWHEYSFDLAGYDLSSLNCGFVVAFNGEHDPGGDGVMVYFDDVRFDSPPANNLRLLQSYRGQLHVTEGDDTVYRNSAYVYDNAAAALAYMARGGSQDWQQAGAIVQAFHWALHHEVIDFGAGQAYLRDAYRSGPIRDPARDEPREAGWTDPAGKWWGAGREMSTGNNAWAVLALLQYYRHSGQAQYLDDAALVATWIHENCHDGVYGGYMLGLDASGEPLEGMGKAKSTEHNIDVFAAFSLLAEEYRNLGDAAAADLWQCRAADAAIFVMHMHDPGQGRFYVGTDDSGWEVNDSVWALDPQAWSVLALGADLDYANAIDWTGPLRWAEQELLATSTIPARTIHGFDFGKVNPAPPGEPDGVWTEGTAQMAAAYAAIGKSEIDQSAHFRGQLVYIQAEHPNGDGQGLVAACADGLTTGFQTVYGARLHTGATAWGLIYELQFNPFRGSGLIPGDANRDGVVDALDYGSWSLHYQQSGAGWEGGDFNGDGVTDGLDYNLWSLNYHAALRDGSGAEPAAVAAALPEARGFDVDAAPAGPLAEVAGRVWPGASVGSAEALVASGPPVDGPAATPAGSSGLRAASAAADEPAQEHALDDYVRLLELADLSP